MRRILLVAAVLATAACTPATPVNTTAPTEQGRSAASVTAKFGAPETSRQGDGRMVYAWTSRTRMPATPELSTRVSYAAGRPNTIDTLSYPDPPETETCTLRAVVDGAGQIVSSDWDGSKAACYAMQQKLTSP